MKILLKNGKLIDYSTKINEKMDILIEDGIILKIAKEIIDFADEIIDCTNLFYNYLSYAKYKSNPW